MTKREQYLKALRNEKVDNLVWAPNIDYWFHVNKAENTIPSKYAGMSRNDIVRTVGGAIWGRAGGLKTVRDSSVKESTFDMDGDHFVELSTPLGTIRTAYAVSDGQTRAWFLKEHYVKDLESLKVMKYVTEATHFEPDYDQQFKALEEIGDDGILLSQTFCVPFLQFVKTDAGYMNGYYMWMDYRKEVEALINLHFENYLKGYRLLAEGPADVISTADNMDGTMISPEIFKEYAVPFYKEVKKVMLQKNKIFKGHWCGRTQNLLPLVKDCGLDVVEAVVTEPMANIKLVEALNLLEGNVVLQGGIPAVLVCNEGGTFEEFEKYIRDVILPLKSRKGFILGMSDNVPPNADFKRVEAIAGMIA